MNSRKTYISYVIQTGNSHVHYAEVVDLPRPETAIYSDNTGQEVYRWMQTKQQELYLVSKW